MNAQPELIAEPPASIDVECACSDLERVIQAHRDKGYRPCCLTVKRGGYAVSFARIGNSQGYKPREAAA